MTCDPGDLLVVLECHQPSTAVTVTRPVTKMCPIKDEVDEGTVTITWTADLYRTIELHSLNDYLHTYAGNALTHEEFAHLVQLDVALALHHGDPPRPNGLSSSDASIVTVTSTWTTAGMDVTVATVPYVE